MTIRLLLGMESGSTTHPPGAILNLNPHEDAVRVPHEYWAVGAGEGLARVSEVCRLS